MRPESEDWELMRELESRLKSARSKPTAQELSAVRRAAAQVGLHEEQVQQSLDTVGGHGELVIEIRRRIREGSQRLMRAFTRAQQLLDEGNATAAKEVLEAARAREQISFYRETVEEQLRSLGMRAHGP